jgi:hypothetical protein
MSRAKPLAALAAVTAALALAVPPAGASAGPAVRTASAGFGGHLLPGTGGFVPGSLPCRILVYQLQAAVLSGNTPLANFISLVLLYSGCGGAAT